MREIRSPRRRWGAWLIVLAGLGWFLPLAAEEPSTPPDGVAASVNGEPITTSLVETFLRNDREALGIDPRTKEGAAMLAQLHVNIIDELIDRALIAQGAKAMGIAPTEAQLDAAEAKMLDFCGSVERYEAYTAQNGFHPPGLP